MKRLLIATILGLLFGLVCLGLASSGKEEIPQFLGISIVLGRMLIGFGIGISKFEMKHWSINGLLMGFVFSLPAAFGTMLAPENPDFTREAIFLSTLVMGIIYGLLIEFITTVILKAK